MSKLRRRQGLFRSRACPQHTHKQSADHLSKIHNDAFKSSSPALSALLSQHELVWDLIQHWGRLLLDLSHHLWSILGPGSRAVPTLTSITYQTSLMPPCGSQPCEPHREAKGLGARILGYRYLDLDPGTRVARVSQVARGKASAFQCRRCKKSGFNL